MKFISKKFMFMLYVEKGQSFYHMDIDSVVLCFEIKGTVCRSESFLQTHASNDLQPVNISRLSLQPWRLEIQFDY